MRNLQLIAFVLLAVFFSWGTMHAQDATPEELLRTEVTSQVKSANFPRMDGYESYVVGDVRIEDDWGLFNVISSPISPTEESGFAPNVLLGFAQWDGNNWHAYIEFTPSYYQNLHDLPTWLEWLRIREEGVHTASAQEVISVPALPFSFGEAWRYTQGPNLGHSPDNSVDFANWPRGVPGPVHAVEGGTVLAVGYTGTKELLPNNCLTVERSSDQLKVYYLHLNENDVNAFQIGDPIDVGQFLGYTSMSNGCGGGPTGLHIHIEFRKISNPYAKPSEGWHTMIGSSFNGWIIGGSELTVGSGKTPLAKGAFTAYEDENAYTNEEKDVTKRMRNRVGSSDPECTTNMLSGVSLYTGYKCDGRSVSVTTPTSGTYLITLGMNNALNSLSVAPGWHTILYDVDPGQGNKTCFYGSITDLRNYNYPGSSMKIAGTPSSIEVYDKGICPDGFFPPVKPLLCPANLVNASSNSNACSPQDITPPTASGYSVSLQNGSANLVAQGVSDSDSGIQRVQFSAKWNGEWRVVGSKTTAPYSFTWNMCASGVPDTQIEFGLEVWDNAGNNFLWSEHGNNPLATKSFNCNPSGGTTTGSIKLYSLANNAGSVVWSGETGFSNGPNANSYALLIPSGWSARVWRGDDRGGEMRCFSSSVPNLQDHGWHLAIQSIEGFNSNVCGDANTGLVVMCADGVGCWQFGAGYQPLAGFNMNDIMTSVYAVPSNMSVMLYREGRRRGTVECYNSPRNPLPSGWPWDLYKQATDAYVFTAQGCPSSQHGTVLFYSGKNHEGHIWSAGNEPGVVNMSDLGSREYFNDSAESMRIPPDKSAIIYADDNKGGEVSECLTGDRSDLGNFNNKVSSVEMFDNTNCKPSAPTSLTVIQTAPTSIWLAWNHPAMSDVAFKIYRWNGADFGFIAQTEVGANSYLDENLPCNSDQFYKLSAVTGRGESAQIGWIHAKTDLCQYPGEPVLHNGTGSRTVLEGEPIIFVWDSAANAVEYNAKLLGPKSYESGWQDGNQWVAYNVEPTIYIFQVTARNQRGEGSSAMQFVYVKIAAPEIGAIDSETCSSNRIYWTDNSAYEEKFLVRRGGQIIAEVASVPTQHEYSYLDEGLAESGSYTYTIEAVSPGSAEGSHQNGFSQVKTGVVRKCPLAPVAVNLLSPANSTVFEEGQNITFSWDSGVADYYELNISQTGGAAQTIELGGITHTLNNLPKGDYQWFVYSYTELGKIGSVAGSFTIKEKTAPPPPTLYIYLPLVRK